MCKQKTALPAACLRMAEGTPNRTRKSNWSDDKSLYLVQLYQEQGHVLKVNFSSPRVCNRKKHDIWQNTSQQVNDRFGNGRTATEVKQRWFTISSKSEGKLQKFQEHRNGTGGGPPAPPSLSYNEDSPEETPSDADLALPQPDQEEDTAVLYVGELTQNSQPFLAILQTCADTVRDKQCWVVEKAAQEKAGAAWEAAAAAREKAAAAREKAAAARDKAAAAWDKAAAAREKAVAVREKAAAERENAAAARKKAAAQREKAADQREKAAAARAKAKAIRLRPVPRVMKVEPHTSSLTIIRT